MDNIQRGNVYLADLGNGIGSEQKGIRPVIVVQNDIGNKYSPTVTVLPITTKIHKSNGMPTHVIIDNDGGLFEKSSVMAEQISTIDKSKLIEYIGTIRDKTLRRRIDKALRIQLGIDIRRIRNGGK